MSHSLKKYFLLQLLILGYFSQAQDSSRFDNDVLQIQKKYESIRSNAKETIVFTGSSSIRMWKDIQQRFPEYQIVNSGFGGSQASDLLSYTSELILDYNPTKVFLYEGDNDIFAGKSSKEIIKDIAAIISKIKNKNSATEIIIIAAKPSISRWNLKGKYKRLNRKFKKLCKHDAHLYFADVWKPMLKNKKVIADIFIADGLHMNAQGYNIWYKTISPFLK